MDNNKILRKKQEKNLCIEFFKNIKNVLEIHSLLQYLELSRRNEKSVCIVHDFIKIIRQRLFQCEYLCYYDVSTNIFSRLSEIKNFRVCNPQNYEIKKHTTNDSDKTVYDAICSSTPRRMISAFEIAVRQRRFHNHIFRKYAKSYDLCKINLQ